MQAFASIMDLLQTLGLRPHFWFPNRQFLTQWGCQPPLNLQPRGPGPIFITHGTGCPAIPPGTGYPLVAFYNMHGLQWDYSLIPVTTQDINNIEYGKNIEVKFFITA